MRFLTDRRLVLILAVMAVYLLYGLAFGDDANTGAELAVTDSTTHEDSGHGGPVLGILLGLIVILLVAKLGGDVFERWDQPAVLGELVMGMILGNLYMVGIDLFEPFKHDLTLEILAELGVIILLFDVGLESSVKEMMKVGLASFMVALFGVVAPFFLGWGVGYWFLPNESIYVHVFIGATLTATSVGITARVLKDIGKSKSREAKIILGAAVIDDILGLVILAVVAGIIGAVNAGQGDGVSSGMILWIISKAVLFIVGAIVIGSFILPHFFRFAIRLRGKGVFLSFCLLVCFGLALLAGKVGLAPIVGAFAAGLILDDIHFHQFREKGEHNIEELIAPIATFLVPIFFVRMGMMVELSTFGQVEILGFAVVMTLAAIAGKQACSLAIFDKQTNRIAIGLGMIPRGEVGLIFAGIGAKLMLDGDPVISTSTYSAVVIMVIVTTLVTPPALKMSLLRGDKKTPAQAT
ncbi:MAG: cation:proton antiporter [candidate division Zixibacteria bacterium]|nr:cation:proton antiporter [candidate division Zixibacteria bacterium]MDH3938021.1 cation:proton antiporter [candidate division Zixibacteria bacterium]MDH4035567.1 cation:proton antiporter [candidate division Zixibacteria bacterium]